MRRLIMFLSILWVCCSCVKGQIQLSTLIRIADSCLLQNKIHNKKIICTTYKVIGIHNGEGKSGSVRGNENLKINNYEYVLLFYTIFNKKINYKFEIEILIDSANIAHIPDSQLQKIPFCILTKSKCSYISKNRALKLAANDKLSFADNTHVTFIQAAPDCYFWEIVSQDKKIHDFAEAKSNMNFQSVKINPENIRYINAVSGNVLSKLQFDSLGYLRIPL